MASRPCWPLRLTFLMRTQPAAEVGTDSRRLPAGGENSYAELKNRLRGAAFILRLRSPELVCQELFAFLTVYQALCALKLQTAGQAGIDPDRISFTVTVRVARDHASSPALLTQPGLAEARRQAIRDLLDDLLPRRRDRQRERVKKPPRNTFPSKKRDQARQPGKVTYKIKISRKVPHLGNRLNSPALQVRSHFQPTRRRNLGLSRFGRFRMFARPR